MIILVFTQSHSEVVWGVVMMIIFSANAQKDNTLQWENNIGKSCGLIFHPLENYLNKLDQTRNYLVMKLLRRLIHCS